jgi:hypothetical protein
MGLFAIQPKHHFSFEDEIHLLLSAFALVVIVNKRLISVRRHEEIRSERVDPERVLERVPRRLIRTAV